MQKNLQTLSISFILAAIVFGTLNLIVPDEGDWKLLGYLLRDGMYLSLGMVVYGALCGLAFWYGKRKERDAANRRLVYFLGVLSLGLGLLSFGLSLWMLRTMGLTAKAQYADQLLIIGGALMTSFPLTFFMVKGMDLAARIKEQE